MRGILRVFITFATIFATGCSWTPSLEETTGSVEPQVFIGDVVHRVRCEIYDTALYLRKHPSVGAWAANWSAKVNLTLTVANTGALTPSIQAINLGPNAYFNGVSPATAKKLGVSSTPTTVPQKFAFGANATLSEVATRTELVVFSVAFADFLSSDSKNLKPPTGCERISGELRGNLGLQSWVESAFSPIEHGDLSSAKAPKPEPATIADITQRLCNVAGESTTKLPENCKPDSPTEDSVEKFMWTGAKVFDDACVDEAFLVYFEKGFAKLRDKDGDSKPGSVEDQVKRHARQYRNVPCKDLDILVKQADALNRLEKAQQAIKKSYQEATSYYLANITPYFKLISSSPNKDALKEAGNHLQQMDLIFDSEQFKAGYTKFVIASLAPGLKGCHAELPEEQIGLEGKLLKEMAKIEELLARKKEPSALSAEIKKIDGLLEEIGETKDGTLQAELKKIKELLGSKEYSVLLTAMKTVEELLAKKKAQTMGLWTKDGRLLAVEEAEEQSKRERCKNVYYRITRASAYAPYIEKFVTNADALSTYIKSFTPSKPIDSLTHTVIFLVTYGVGIQPQWTLVQVAGPLTQLANTQGVRTHQLIVALGPDAENSQNIQTQAILGITR